MKRGTFILITMQDLVGAAIVLDDIFSNVWQGGAGELSPLLMVRTKISFLIHGREQKP